MDLLNLKLPYIGEIIEITLKNMFICAWIDLEQLNRNEMDLLLKDILTQIKQQENEKTNIN